jgi:hypothetical protein
VPTLAPDCRLLLTYVNPNFGFTGVSYRASNWIRIGEEHGTHYYYVDDVYITDRELARTAGSLNPAVLYKRFGARLSRRDDLKPLQVYAYPLESRLRKQLSSGLFLRFDVAEWVPIVDVVGE